METNEQKLADYLSRLDDFKKRTRCTKVVYVMIAPQGAGKNYVIYNKIAPMHHNDIVVIEPDELIKGKWSYDKDKLAWKEAFILLEEALESGHECVIFNAMCLSPRTRADIIQILEIHTHYVVACIVHAGLATCLKRNHQRGDRNGEYGKVPDKQIIRCYDKFRNLVWDKNYRGILQREGFDDVIRINNEDNQ
jgi:predicted kinase